MTDLNVPDHLQAELSKAQADYYTAEARLRNAEAERAEVHNFTERLDVEGPLVYMAAIDSANVTRTVLRFNEISAKHPGCDIEVLFSSPGGDVLSGFLLVDYIENLKAKGHKVILKGSGMVASMGAIILQVATERVMTPSAFMLIHEVSSVSMGNTSQLKDSLDHINKFQRRALDILAEKASLTAEEIEDKWARRDWVLSADEALELGFVDKIEV